MQKWFFVVFYMCFVSFCGASIGAAEGIEDVITADNLGKFVSRKPDKLLETLETNRSSFTKYGIINGRRLYHFLATVATETGGISRLDENMKYSTVDRTVKIFGRHLGGTLEERRATAKRLLGNEIGLANQVYGHRLGNRGRHTMDGWNYRGSGFIQLTGRGNFEARRDAVREAVGGDIVASPDLVRTPKPGLFAALSFWRSIGANEVADKGNSQATVKRIRKMINGGFNGLDEAILWHAKAVRVFGPLIEPNLEASGILAASRIDEKIALRRLLQQKGVEIVGLEAVPNDLDIKEGLRKFQSDRGLSPSGQLDDNTFIQLVDPQDISRENLCPDPEVAECSMP